MFKPKSVGTRVNATFVELVDLFKTFAELAGLPAPEAGVEGKSFAPVFDDPATALAPVDADVGQVAWAQYDRCPKNESELWTETACKQTARVNISFMGFSMRTVDWRCGNRISPAQLCSVAASGIFLIVVALFVTASQVQRVAAVRRC